MIITLKNYLHTLDENAREATKGHPLGKKRVASGLQYSKVGMWSILLCSSAIAIVGLAVCIVSAARDHLVSVVAGIFMILIGIYVMIISVKEKARLDLVTEHFKDLPEETKEEILVYLTKDLSGSTVDILGLIERLLNIVFDRGGK